MTRQRIKQLANSLSGLCQDCDRPYYRGTKFCRRHLLKRRHRQRCSQDNRPWRPGGPGRPPADRDLR